MVEVTCWGEPSPHERGRQKFESLSVQSAAANFGIDGAAQAFRKITECYVRGPVIPHVRRRSPPYRSIVGKLLTEAETMNEIQGYSQAYDS